MRDVLNAGCIFWCGTLAIIGTFLVVPAPFTIFVVIRSIMRLRYYDSSEVALGSVLVFLIILAVIGVLYAMMFFVFSLNS